MISWLPVILPSYTNCLNNVLGVVHTCAPPTLKSTTTYLIACVVCQIIFNGELSFNFTVLKFSELLLLFDYFPINP